MLNKTGPRTEEYEANKKENKKKLPTEKR